MNQDRSVQIGAGLAPRSAPRASGVVDLTHNVASVDELRRRATEGDQRAIAELARRTALAAAA